MLAVRRGATSVDYLVHKSARYVDEALWQRAPVDNTLHLDYDLAARVVSRKSLRIMRCGCSINGHHILLVLLHRWLNVSKG